MPSDDPRADPPHQSRRHRHGSRSRRGVRNTVGFDWHPVSKQLYFTDNGRDWASEDVPEDELNRVTKVGQHFGSPYCYQGDFPDPEFGWGRPCSEFEQPVAKMGPHSASLGMRFNTGNMFPAKYKNAIFVARHGSWNRTKKFGGDIVAVFLNKDGTVKNMETFVSGFIGPDNNYIGRPGRRAVPQGRLDADLRRLQRRGLSPDLRQPEERCRRSNATSGGGGAAAPPSRFKSTKRSSCGSFLPPRCFVAPQRAGARALTYRREASRLPRLPRRERRFRNQPKCPRLPACRRTSR